MSFFAVSEICSALRVAYQKLESQFLTRLIRLCVYLKDPEDMERITDKTRKLGLIVVRGTQVSLVSPQEGMEEIANPFLVQETEE
jgi:hypothetical protein